jgi:hypothetical protein
VVSVDGKGGPMITAEAVKLKATLGPGEQRQQQKAALVGVSDTVDPTPRSPEVLAELLVDPEAAPARRQQAGTRDEAPRAQPVRRVASLVRTKPAVRALLQADAERREPQHRTPLVVRRAGALGLGTLATTRFKPWKRVPCVLDIMPVMSDLWCAANALFGEASQAGQHRGAAAADGDALRPGGLRQRRSATHPHEAATAEGGPGDAGQRHHVRPPSPALDARRRLLGRRFARRDRRRGD